MADIVIACPSCSQNMTCDDAWGGQQIQCPTCQAPLIVPAKEAPAAPAKSHNPLVPQVPGSTRLAIGGGGAQVAAQAGRNIPVRNLAPPPAKKQSPLIKVAIGLGVVAVLGAAVYFGWPLVQKMQEKSNEARRKEEAGGGESQVAHISGLYDMLDATEPGGSLMGGGGGGSSRSPRPRNTGVGKEIPLDNDDEPAAQAATTKITLPIVPTTYTLETASAKIPEGRVNGMLSGTNFVPETIRLDQVGTAQVLRFTQGALTAPDREILIYLRLKPADRTNGLKLNITQDMRGAGVPQIMKRWKPGPRYAPNQKSYPTGYAMKLELGKISDGPVSGKIYLALPDNEQSFAGGLFKAANGLPEEFGADAAAAVPPAARVPVQERYGVQP